MADDRKAFKLRQTANTDFDDAQEKLHEAAILRHRLSRTTATEAQLAENLKEDKAKIVRDEQKLRDQKKLMKKLALAKIQESKEAKVVKKKSAVLHAAIAKLRLDQQHEQDQAGSVSGLLKKATKYATMAVNGLKTSQQLRIKSETDIADDTAAAREYEGSSAMEHRSKAWTRQALDLRSKARLAQEYVAILKGMVAHDTRRVRAAASASAAAGRAQARLRMRVEDVRKKLRLEAASKIEADEAKAALRRHRWPRRGPQVARCGREARDMPRGPMACRDIGRAGGWGGEGGAGTRRRCGRRRPRLRGRGGRRGGTARRRCGKCTRATGCRPRPRRRSTRPRGPSRRRRPAPDALPRAAGRLGPQRSGPYLARGRQGQGLSGPISAAEARRRDPPDAGPWRPGRAAGLGGGEPRDTRDAGVRIETRPYGSSPPPMCRPGPMPAMCRPGPMPARAGPRQGGYS